MGFPVLFDGVNEKGLASGLFYFPTSAGYMPYAVADAANTIAPWELGSWMLENFASVDEVKANIGKIVVPAVVYEGWGFAPEVHFIVSDASGKSMVIEYVGGKLTLYDAPLGVITNSPTFDWQMTNLRNYVNFSMTNVPPVKVGSLTLKPFGRLGDGRDAGQSFGSGTNRQQTIFRDAVEVDWPLSRRQSDLGRGSG